MTRRRWIQDRNTGELIEVTPDYEQLGRHEARNNGLLWNDRQYEGARTTDGIDISSRTKHRNFMRERGLTTVDDFKDTWAKAREQRERLYTQGGTFSRRDVERAIHQLQNR